MGGCEAEKEGKAAFGGDPLEPLSRNHSGKPDLPQSAALADGSRPWARRQGSLAGLDRERLTSYATPTCPSTAISPPVPLFARQGVVAAAPPPTILSPRA